MIIILDSNEKKKIYWSKYELGTLRKLTYMRAISIFSMSAFININVSIY